MVVVVVVVLVVVVVEMTMKMTVTYCYGTDDAPCFLFDLSRLAVLQCWGLESGPWWTKPS